MPTIPRKPTTKTPQDAAPSTGGQPRRDSQAQTRRRSAKPRESTQGQANENASYVELARYVVQSGERVVAAKPSAGEALCIVDLPATGEGPQYVVEPRVETEGVKALVDDYVSQAMQLGEVPMRARS